MDVTPQLAETAPLIQRYGAAGFRIAGNNYAGSVLISSSSVQPWSALIPEQITFESFAPLIALGGEIELILVGSGNRQIFLAPDLRQKLKCAGLILDCMDTGAAARTFNVLLTEGRRVAAALLPIE